MSSIGDKDFSKEFGFRTSRSSGPGGQNVNKVETRVTLLFDVGNSQLLSAEQKSIIQQKLSARISADGILSVVSQKGRTQKVNKELAVARFYEVVDKALAKPKKRIRTRISRTQKEKLLEQKRRHSEKKARRRKSWE